jgi:hypothetical protein
MESLKILEELGPVKYYSTGTNDSTAVKIVLEVGEESIHRVITFNQIDEFRAGFGINPFEIMEKEVVNEMIKIYENKNGKKIKL